MSAIADLPSAAAATDNSIDLADDDNTSAFNARSLELEEIGPDKYLSVDLWRPKGNRGVFGGQVIGQALAAASKAVGGDYRCNSIHCYFLAAGQNTEMIAYKVRRVREGSSYCSRLVTAKQGGRVIFIATASFQRPEPSVLRHQYAMPAVPSPESLVSREEHLRRKQRRSGNMSAADIAKLAEYDALPVDSRHISLPADKRGLPVNAMWLRAKGDMSALGPCHHQSMLAYASDFALLSTSLRPFQMDQPGATQKLSMLVSLDHTIWFHEPFRADEWFLYVMESPRTAGGRGLAIGRIYSRDGVLVASTAQEGVARSVALEPDNEETLQFASHVVRFPQSHHGDQAKGQTAAKL
ncbi:acyl-CoA thioesterase [Coemansia thaxteri]|uniref:Acyl-CoA thioesterase n=1 Tax=Coemansia thaxteri TaxID=2663907 RepID=A0A9W8ELI5_9FUNG|nr:acyl-CoA thioesterase [Coemansia thaxteri]KAJ2008194.1 acyl-CoA thioesterase [Coemansia thaxteri]KAJ2470064.1 acyl-CoA thioesterase [Coemansia sp. RSA 2322]KAJ2487431.1 acyl-CoA thioesterase [Coemansia sp. RSA 2320]